MKKQDTPSRYLNKIVVRVPDGMREAIQERARMAGRSMNMELVQILSAALNHENHGEDGMARGDAELRIRIPHDVRDRMKSKADQRNRTMNAEIVVALQGHLDGGGGAKADLRIKLAGQTMSGFLAQPKSVDLWNRSFAGDPDARQFARNCLDLADMLIEEAGKP